MDCETVSCSPPLRRFTIERKMSKHLLAGTKIDDLPEDVLCCILSRLSMRDAARASVCCSILTRAWRSYPHLTFDMDTLGLHALYPDEVPDKKIRRERRKKAAMEFVRIVDTIVARHRVDTALESLIIRFGHLRRGRRYAACVDRWVRFALASTTTRRLKVDLFANGDPGRCYHTPTDDRLRFDFPCSLLHSSSSTLEHLDLRLGSLRLGSLGPLPALANLKTLVLSDMLITSEDLDRLLSPCHKLQSLKLRHCNELVDVNISSLSARLKPQLRFLAVKQCFSVRTIDVSDSAVTSLQFVGYKRTKSSLLFGEGAPRGFPNITTASIHVYCKIEAAAELRLFEPTRLAHVLPKLEDLFLSFTWPVEMVVVPTTGSIFCHLKRLELKMDDIVSTTDDQRGKDHFLFMPEFLVAAPVLEDLTLHLMRFVSALKHRRGGGAYSFRRYPCRRAHENLKTVTVTGFEADLACLELALYILENARALERLSLDPAWTGHISRSALEKLCLTNQRWTLEMQLARQAIERHITPAVPPSVQLQIL